jgi:hypothetical protein
VLFRLGTLHEDGPPQHVFLTGESDAERHPLTHADFPPEKLRMINYALFVLALKIALPGKAN